MQFRFYATAEESTEKKNDGAQTKMDPTSWF